jgi:FAD/FMN-containing dehydrogenase
MTDAALVSRLAALVGDSGLVTDPGEIEPYLTDWRGFYHGKAVVIVRPKSTEEVAAVMRACAQAGAPVVPQGGNTGMCGAATPDTSGTAVVLTLSRMNRILDVDPLNNTMTVEAGCILANVQEAAAGVDRYFPLSLGAEGSCQIGGNLATNAGGVNVLRYGNTRDLVLGLEVVLPDGRVWNGLRALRKDNTGYDLKQLFIGAEGTLGIITRAVLKLFPRPASTVTAWCAVRDPQAAIELLARLRRACGESISAFELVSRNCLDFVLELVPGIRDPLGRRFDWYILLDVSDAREAGPARSAIEDTLGACMEAGLVLDATIAESEGQAQSLWRIRESIPDAAKAHGLCYRHDISVAVSRIPEFIATAGAALEREFPGREVICFGHVGDGNLHYNCYVPGRRRDDPAAIAATDVNRVVHEVVHGFNGSISAEHGVGQSKREEITRYKSEVEMDLMRSVKRALDPQGLMNPGKVV